jgi:hypothetical protein
MPVVRWGLAAKLFATVLLLGAVAVLVTASLSYVRSPNLTCIVRISC